MALGIGKAAPKQLVAVDVCVKPTRAASAIFREAARAGDAKVSGEDFAKAHKRMAARISPFMLAQAIGADQALCEAVLTGYGPPDELVTRLVNASSGLFEANKIWLTTKAELQALIAMLYRLQPDDLIAAAVNDPTSKKALQAAFDRVRPKLVRAATAAARGTRSSMSRFDTSLDLRLRQARKQTLERKVELLDAFFKTPDLAWRSPSR